MHNDRERCLTEEYPEYVYTAFQTVIKYGNRHVHVAFSCISVFHTCGFAERSFIISHGTVIYPWLCSAKPCQTFYSPSPHFTSE